MKIMLFKLLPQTGLALLIFCLLTKSAILLTAATIITAVLIVICAAAGSKETGRENKKCQNREKSFCR